MKKFVFLIVMALTLCRMAHAQYRHPRIAINNLDDYTVLDSTYLKVTYRLLSIKDPNKPAQAVEDMQTLQIGRNVSKFYSEYLLQYSEGVAEQLRENPGLRTIRNNSHEGSYGYEIFRNYPEGMITVTNHDSELQATYRYEEISPQMQWTLVDETDTILSYLCRKATIVFRGRAYTAWFATQIPVSSGPWKFGGLPGLILKIEDAERHYVWECVGLELSQNREPIRWYNHPRNPGTANRYTPISREELDRLYRRYHRDEAAFRTVNGGSTFHFSPDGSSEQINTSSEIPYNPIELE